MSYDSPLGDICLAVDSWPFRQRSKLGSVGDSAEARFYMLATYCFDAARKLEYVFKATKPYALMANRELAREIKRDNEAIAAAGEDWKAMAQATEKVLIRLLGEITREHDELLNRVAGAK